MFLADLVSTLVEREALPRSILKDLRTSTNYLALALGYADPASCPIDLTTKPHTTWVTALNAHFEALTAQGRTIGTSTRNNTRTNLRRILRVAGEQGLLSVPVEEPLLAPPTRTAWRSTYRVTGPYRHIYTGKNRDAFGLPQRQWPPSVQAGWQDYQERLRRKIRPVTFQTYAGRLSSYLGYLAHIVGHEPTWEDCFDAEKLEAFVSWHGARSGRESTTLGLSVVIGAAARAKALGLPQARDLAALSRSFPKPDTVHEKRNHSLSLERLLQVARDSLAQGRIPYGTNTHQELRNPGSQRAGRFQKGVMLTMMLHVPVRPRNIREIRLNKNLYKDDDGHWHLDFRGKELKVAMRNGKENVYQIDLNVRAAGLIPVLEEFLADFRPKLPGADTSRYLFLTRHGRMFSGTAFRDEIAEMIAMKTGKRFFPHLIRTVWASTYIKKTGDYTGAAVMLGDTVQMVLKAYHDIEVESYQDRAADFITNLLYPGTAKRTG